MTGRTFAYCRVSTAKQTEQNQVQAILSNGYQIEPHRIIEETISGSVEAMKRPEFSKLIDRLESGDELVVLKLDRLGRDNIDVQQTISSLSERGIKVVSLDLPVRDLTSAEGKLMLQMFSAFAEFERERIRERTSEGLKRAKAQGKVLGRPKGSKSGEKIRECQKLNLSQSETARQLSISLSTVKRNWIKE